MTDNMGSKEFGLWCALPKNIETAWGCRAILHDKYETHKVYRRIKGRRTLDFKEERRVYVDFVWDRQSCYGTESNRQALLRLLRKGGQKKNPLDRAFKEVEKLAKKYQIGGTVSRTHTLYEKNGVTVLGDTNASGGYIYIIAWADNHVLEAEVKKENKRLANAEKKKQREINRKKRELRAMFLKDSSLTRVCVESPIYGTTPEIAKAQYGITPDVIFLRSDDWSLGAPMKFAEESDNLWCDGWVGFVTKNDNVKYISPYGTRDLISEIEEGQ